MLPNNDKVENEEKNLSIESDNNPIIEKTDKVKNKNIWLILISVILLFLLVINAFQFFFSYKQNQINAQRANTYEIRVQEAEELLERQQETILGLLEDYENDVYDNPRVDNIYHQQLIAAEYSVIGLQLIAIQNSQIIQLLASLP